MKYVTRFHLMVLVVAQVFLHSEVATATPSWCENTPKHDLTFRNYVGRSTASTLDQAFREAVVQARKEAVEENFGFQFHVQTNGNFRAHSDSASQSLLTQDFEERSKAVRLDGFERVDTYSLANDSSRGEVSVCVWFRYPVNAIATEALRLSTLKAQGLVQRSELVIQGSDEDSKRGVVKINSTPTGAKVSIDGRSWGETPIELRGKLTQGQHHLILDHPNYERAVRDFEVDEGAITRVDEMLKRGTAHLHIATVPEGGMVMVQGRHVGESPVGPLDVPAGEWITVVIEHPEAKRYERRIQLDRNELWDKTIELELKKSHLVFSVYPKDTEVELDYKALSTAGETYDVELTAGNHRIRLAKSGFSDLNRELFLRGGEASDLGTLSMKPVSVPVPVARSPASSSEPHAFEPHWVIGLMPAQWTSSPITNPDIGIYRLGASLEYLPFWLIGLRVGASVGYGSSQIERTEIRYTGVSADFGVRIHFLWIHLFGMDSIFIEPQASFTRFGYDVIPLGNPEGLSRTVPSQSSFSTGFNVGYRIFSVPNADTRAVWGATLRYGVDGKPDVSGGYSGQSSTKMDLEFSFGF